jgi:hypothetical protein
MKAARALSKAQFIERVAFWAERHNGRFDESRLDEWIKQKLAFPADTGPSQGKRRTFTYGRRHYRRALQLVRFHSQGIRDTDEIIIQLFIRGYEAPSDAVRDGARPDVARDRPWLDTVRRSLRKEFNKTRAKLNTPLKSKFADNEGEITWRRKKQFLGQVGELDLRFRKAEIVIPDDDLIAAVRAARSPDDLKIDDSLRSVFDSFVHGILEIGGDGETRIERIVQSSSDEEYDATKEIFKFIRIAFHTIGLGDSAIGIAFRTANIALSGRELTALLLATVLKLVHT